MDWPVDECRWPVLASYYSAAPLRRVELTTKIANGVDPADAATLVAPWSVERCSGIA